MSQALERGVSMCISPVTRAWMCMHLLESLIIVLGHGTIFISYCGRWCWRGYVLCCRRR